MGDTAQQANFLALFQKHPDCYYTGARIDFTDVKDHSASVTQGQNVFKKIIPSFNNDGLYFTDSFVLAKDRLQNDSNFQDQAIQRQLCQSKQKFEERIQKMIAQMQAQVKFPFIQVSCSAQPDNSFCQICRTSFDQYHSHIRERNHIRNSEFSKGHKYVNEICRYFKKSTKPLKSSSASASRKPVKKSKPIRSKKSRWKKPSKNEKQKEKERLQVEEKLGQCKNCLQLDNTDGLKSKKNDNLENIINKGQKRQELNQLVMSEKCG